LKKCPGKIDFSKRIYQFLPQMAWLSCEITEMLVYPIDYNSEKLISLFT